MIPNILVGILIFDGFHEGGHDEGKAYRHRLVDDEEYGRIYNVLSANSDQSHA